MKTENQTKKRGRHNAAFLTPTQLKNYVKAAQETHDAHAIEALCNAFRPLILKEAHKPNVHAALGEDAENTAWEIFLEFIYKYRGNKFSLLPGLVAKTLHYELLHRLHKEGGLEDCDALDGNETLKNTLLDKTDFFADSDTSTMLDEAIRKLSVKQQHVIVELYYHDISMESYSKNWHCSKQSVLIYKKRALAKLHKLLEQ